MGKRPPGVKAPPYLSKSPPVPHPAPPAPDKAPPPGDQTRYGDWTKKGIAVDF